MLTERERARIQGSAEEDHTDTASQRPTDRWTQAPFFPVHGLESSQTPRPHSWGGRTKDGNTDCRLPVTLAPTSRLDSPNALLSQQLSPCQAAGHRAHVVPGQWQSLQGGGPGGSAGHPLTQASGDGGASKSSVPPTATGNRPRPSHSALHFHDINETCCKFLPGGVACLLSPDPVSLPLSPGFTCFVKECGRNSFCPLFMLVVNSIQEG